MGDQRHHVNFHFWTPCFTHKCRLWSRSIHRQNVGWEKRGRCACLSLCESLHVHICRRLWLRPEGQGSALSSKTVMLTDVFIWERGSQHVLSILADSLLYTHTAGKALLSLEKKTFPGRISEWVQRQTI